MDQDTKATDEIRLKLKIIELLAPADRTDVETAQRVLDWVKKKPDAS